MRRTKHLILTVALMLAVVFVLPGVSEGQPEGKENKPSCFVCHAAAAKSFSESSHSGVGLGCDTCHGGNPDYFPTKEESRTKVCVDNDSFKGIVRGKAIVELCSGCHSDNEKMHQYSLRADQFTLYRQSVHGKAVYEKGSEDAATCGSCHGVHDILPATNPKSSVYPTRVPETCDKCHGDEELMKRHGLKWDTAEMYTKSVHGQNLLVKRQLSNPSCKDCHGSHGAAPPGVTEVASVCGKCHVNTRRYFSMSRHAEGMEECVTCHGHHGVMSPTVAMFTGDATGECGACHEAGDDEYEAASRIVAAIQELQQTIDGVTAEIDQARELGIFVGTEKGFVDEARETLVKLIPETHTVDVDRIEGNAKRGISQAEKAMDRLRVRKLAVRDRKIFASVLLLAILLVIAMLLLKLKRLSRIAHPE